MQIKEIDIEEWSVLWEKVPNDNLLQSWIYGLAKCKSEGLHMKYFAITNEGREISLVQVLLRKIPVIGTIARINRGPLLIDSEFDNSEDNLFKSIEIILHETRRRNWRILQIAPEIERDLGNLNRLRELGLRPLKNISWASGLFSLNKSTEDMMMSLNGKWRNCLKKGIKLGVEVKLLENSEDNINMLLEQYKTLQDSREFTGISDELIQELASSKNRHWDFNIFVAHLSENNEFLGLLVSVRYGARAIYLIGATNFLGRKYQANYVLLWEAILDAKSKECSSFDIGGLNESTTKGISHFKKGLQSEMYDLCGEYRYYNLKFNPFS